jgi:maleate isomerase
MPQQPFSIGLILPAPNTVMEPDFHRSLGDAAAVSTTRMFLELSTREDETKMVREELPWALTRIRPAAPDAVVFGCTSAGSLGGIEHDLAIGRSITETLGVPGVTVVDSVLRQLRELRARRVAVFTPYVEDLTQSVEDCVTEAGFEVVKAAGMDIVVAREIGWVTPDEILAFVEREFCGVEADCIFLSCTNWRGVEAIPEVRKRLGLPVVSSNQACIERVRQLLDVMWGRSGADGVVRAVRPGVDSLPPQAEPVEDYVNHRRRVQGE